MVTTGWRLRVYLDSAETPEVEALILAAEDWLCQPDLGPR